MSKTIRWLLTGSGGMLLLWSLFETSATSLNQQALASYRGGADVYCAGTFPNPTGHCNECLSNGNGGFVKCSSTSLDMTWQYVIGQNPAQRWDQSDVSCGGNLLTWSAPTCPELRTQRI